MTMYQNLRRVRTRGNVTPSEMYVDRLRRSSGVGFPPRIVWRYEWWPVPAPANR